uniref:Viral protein 6 n=1 Tax=Bluetongue virus TaxID=40051 RepID=A0A142DXW6_BTV|nr:viral protein 6 [Bluetongue virus]
MSAAMLLAPGDVIKRSTEELKQRQIQINLVDWVTEEREGVSSKQNERKEKEGGLNGEETQQKSGEEEKSGKETQNADVDGCVHIAVGSGSGKKGLGGSSSKNANRGDGETGGRDRITDEGDGVNGTNRGRWVVLTDEIARAIESKYGTKVEVYADEQEAQIIEVERSLQKELGITREGVAEQTERLRDLKRREKIENLGRVAARRGAKGRKENRDKNDTSKEGNAKPQSCEEITPVDIIIEGVMSQKKLLSMIGGVERKTTPIGARESAVMLVSNSLKDVARATAYFTAPTGDPNWKDVAREASKKKNILAYTSTGGDVKTEFLHLIDHL